MAMREEFCNHGNWLFRYRSYLPLFFLPAILMEISRFHSGHSIQFGHFWEFACVMVSIIGLGIRIFTVGHVPQRTSGRNCAHQIADQLNTTGIYSLVRHPLYLGNFFIWLGFIMLGRSWSFDLVFMLIYWLYYERIMYAEEEFLRAKFDVTYLKWAAKTPAFLPNFAHWQPPTLPFSWCTALKREYHGICGAVFLFILLKLTSDYTISRNLAHDWSWLELFLGNILMYSLIFVLVKKTRLLHIEGR